MNEDTLYEKYGFSKRATIQQGEQTTLQFMDKLGINLFVNFDTGDFSMKWLFPKSIFTMECPSCSPITNEEHFSKMYNKFKGCVLKWGGALLND